MPRDPLKLGLDFSAFDKAAESFSELEIGPRPSRTNPTGDRKKVLDPREIVAFHVFRLVDFALGSIKEFTPGRGNIRNTFNVRRGGGDEASKGSFNLTFEIASDLEDEKQIIINTLEFGSIPHRIRPKNARFLRFEIAREDFAPGVEGRPGIRTFVIDQGDRIVIFTEQVEHPGTRPFAMFRKTEQRLQPLATAAAAEVARRVEESFRNLDVEPGRIKLK